MAMVTSGLAGMGYLGGARALVNTLPVQMRKDKPQLVRRDHTLGTLPWKAELIQGDPRKQGWLDTISSIWRGESVGPHTLRTTNDEDFRALNTLLKHDFVRIHYDVHEDVSVGTVSGFSFDKELYGKAGYNDRRPSDWYNEIRSGKEVVRLLEEERNLEHRRGFVYNPPYNPAFLTPNGDKWCVDANSLGNVSIKWNIGGSAYSFAARVSGLKIRYIRYSSSEFADITSFNETVENKLELTYGPSCDSSHTGRSILSAAAYYNRSNSPSYEGDTVSDSFYISYRERQRMALKTLGVVAPSNADSFTMCDTIMSDRLCTSVFDYSYYGAVGLQPYDMLALRYLYGASLVDLGYGSINPFVEGYVTRNLTFGKYNIIGTANRAANWAHIYHNASDTSVRIDLRPEKRFIHIQGQEREAWIGIPYSIEGIKLNPIQTTVILGNERQDLEFDWRTLCYCDEGTYFFRDGEGHVAFLGKSPEDLRNLWVLNSNEPAAHCSEMSSLPSGICETENGSGSDALSSLAIGLICGSIALVAFGVVGIYVWKRRNQEGPLDAGEGDPAGLEAQYADLEPAMHPGRRLTPALPGAPADVFPMPLDFPVDAPSVPPVGPALAVNDVELAEIAPDGENVGVSDLGNSANFNNFLGDYFERIFRGSGPQQINCAPADAQVQAAVSWVDEMLEDRY